MGSSGGVQARAEPKSMVTSAAVTIRTNNAVERASMGISLLVLTSRYGWTVESCAVGCDKRCCGGKSAVMGCLTDDGAALVQEWLDQGLTITDFDGWTCKRNDLVP